MFVHMRFFASSSVCICPHVSAYNKKKLLDRVNGNGNSHGYTRELYLSKSFL